MTTRMAAMAALTLATLAFSSSAHALTMTECSDKYKAAQAAGSLNGMKWNDFRKAQCGADATAAAPAATKAAAPATAPATKAAAAPAAAAVTAAAEEPTASNTENAPEPAATSIKPPKGVVFPAKIDPKYASETPGKSRLHTCLDQYKAAKANNTLGGLTWIKKGGGYYSICNTKLKGA